ncbi:MAG: hypothetical protein EAZ65_06430 [Verrucomicrobia bacterium]|nr:MAG: hypothetical protein EAZ84_12335 [Verrucomicrobiota bacterium]TAE87644.1 MAG: hypothetical protein EAZ82_06705 [Verrucomicrobiota bacterium]TAF25421.1 MAG: hypothetical protein EAZ71_08040 [Verrucomicrobiota bacterium]TAF41208.1 MAG: hypothetical protein EAZ65_06430 [Verrucomicrobiota bacterium]
MKRLLLLALLIPLHAEEAPAPAPPAGLPDDGVRVSVLGYHDFSETLPETEMLIRTSKFRKQMEAIKNAGLPVIPMSDFQAWKRGEKEVADKSIVITIDDGWKAVYTDAFPVLKELEFPFTLFLYKNYVNGGGKALTTAMIEEMTRHGATLGSHSVSHPYPATVKASQRKGPEAYDLLLRTEFGESKRFLEAKFGNRISTYAYPGGFHTAEMFPIAAEFGYQHLFTVLPGKVRRSHDDHALPRYIILGTHDRIFDLATGFNDLAGPVLPEAPPAPQSTPFPVAPEPGSIIESRLPLISADLAQVPELDPTTLVMKVSGFGEVPAAFDEATKSFSWQVNRRLRSPACQVSVSWLDKEGKPSEIPLRWSFRIDPEAAYLPKEESPN